MTEHDDARPARPLITPPPGLVPDAERAPRTPVVQCATGGPLIEMPPGLADSGTVRMPAPRPAGVVAPAAPPTPPAPAALAPAPATERPPTPHPTSVTEPPVVSPDSASLAIELPDGRRLPVTGRMLLGRDPAELDGWRGAELVRLADPQRSVSKTHAAIEPDQGALLVHDLASTNGTERATPRGQVLPVAPGHPLRVEAGDALHLGSFTIRLLEGP